MCGRGIEALLPMELGGFRTADLLGAIRGGGLSYIMQEIAYLQVVLA
jgi:hypothetical protein